MNSKVAIHASARNGKTFLKKSFYTTPFKIADITEGKHTQVLHLMFMSSSPGILDGDNYNIDISTDADTAVKMYTQSYQRLFTMKNGAAQSINVNVGENSFLCYLPHPTVPHRNASFTSKSRICLADNAVLIWCEIVTCGRMLNHEKFLFTKYHSITEILHKGKLLIKDNLYLEPASQILDHLGMLEGYTHQGSLIYVNLAGINADPKLELYTLLDRQQDICFGISMVSNTMLVIRILGRKSEQLYHCIQLAASYLEQQANPGNTIKNKENLMYAS